MDTKSNVKNFYIDKYVFKNKPNFLTNIEELYKKFYKNNKINNFHYTNTIKITTIENFNEDENDDENLDEDNEIIEENKNDNEINQYNEEDEFEYSIECKNSLIKDDDKKKYVYKKPEKINFFSTFKTYNMYQQQSNIKDKESFLLNFKNYNENYQYVLDFNSTISQVNYSKIKNIFINVRGGYIPELDKRFFKKSKIKINEIEEDEIQLHILDFASLYASAMEFNNLCLSGICCSTEYPAYFNGKLYNPYDETCFKQMVCELKLNKNVLPFAIFAIRQNIYKSINVIHLEEIKKKRKFYKNEMLKYNSNLSDIRYIVADASQVLEKLAGNARYGKLKARGSAINNPFISSLTTKEGRKALVSLFVMIKLYMFYKNIDDENIGQMLYGDTDSIFLNFPTNLMNDVIFIFNSLNRNNLIMQVNLEKTLDYIMFLTKKKYITIYENEIYAKGIFSKSFGLPSKDFLYNFLFFIFFEYLKNNNLDFDDIFKKLFEKYLSFEDSIFIIKNKINKSVESYSNLTAKLYQLQYSNKTKNIEYLIGNTICHCYFNFFFSFDFDVIDISLKKKLNSLITDLNILKNSSKSNVKNIKNIESKSISECIKKIEMDIKKKLKDIENNILCRKMFENKFIDYNNEEMVKYMKKRPSVNLLITDLVNDYQNIKIDKSLFFIKELYNILKNIFDCLNDDKNGKLLYINFISNFKKYMLIDFEIFQTKSKKRNIESVYDKEMITKKPKKMITDFFKKN